MFVNGIMMASCVHRYVINNLNYKKRRNINPTAEISIIPFKSSKWSLFFSKWYVLSLPIRNDNMINLYITNKHIDKLNLYQSILNWLSIAFNNWQYFCDKLSWWPHAFVHFLINHQIIITSFEFYPLQILKEQNTCHKT